MADRYTAQFRRLLDAVLTSVGDTDPDLRRAVEVRTAFLGGRPVGTTSQLQRH